MSSAAAAPTLRQFVHSTHPSSSLHAISLVVGALITYLLWCEWYGFAAGMGVVLGGVHVGYRNTVVEGNIYPESLIVIKGVGVQLTKTTRKGSASHLFLDSTQVKDVIINEVPLLVRA